MLDKVDTHSGYLEVSLKHSGSLLLWSGRQCYFSKNSTDNKFTKVGEVLLMQHFARFYDDGVNNGHDITTSSSTLTGSSNWKDEYERCSEYVYSNRLTCSFEVVTSILGHHGDIPKRDYLILIAVADRGWNNGDNNGGDGGGSGGVGRFYSTNEVVKFAHQFRLPHNDIWIFSSRASCELLFDAYDELREVGTATTVVGRLDDIVANQSGIEGEEGGGMMMCATKFTSLYPHIMYQGDILEGVVIRFVPYPNRICTMNEGCDALSDWKDMLEEMKKIGVASNELFQLISSAHEKMDDAQPPTTTPVDNIASDYIPHVNLRALAELDDFEDRIDNVLQAFHGPRRRRIQSKNNVCQQDSEGSKDMKSIDVVNVAKEILSDTSHRYDSETLHIARLIQTLDELKIHVAYKIVMEHTTLADTSTTTERCLCILHIQHDSSFARYNAFLRKEGNGGMLLFRGFSIELVPSTTDQDTRIETNRESMDMDVDTPMCAMSSNANDEKLMLKMKFLPYMVRTFICRNGLGILQSSGIGAFENYALNQLRNWKVSDISVRKWMPFFQGWARYCSSSPIAVEGSKYLRHFNTFVELYASGQFQSTPEPTSLLSGVIIIVGPSKYDLSSLSTAISQELQCPKEIVHDIKKLTDKDCFMSKRGGLICTAQIENGVGCMWKLLKQNDEKIFFFVMAQGNDDTSAGDDVYSRKITGMTKSWRKLPCNMMFDLPLGSVDLSKTDAVLEYLRTNEAAMAMMEKLKECSKSNELDERPGLIVFFPLIPGSGKSSLCENITMDIAERNGRRIILIEGDKVKNEGKGKFYPVVTKEIMSQSSSVAILDKNVPPNSLSSLNALCFESKSIALSVLPSGLIDTHIGFNASSHVYPFPLHYLAACMSHVLHREPHIGKLDAGLKDACMIVVQFYCFYRNMTVEVWKEKLRNVGYHGRVMEIPFFKEPSLPDLPHDLKETLELAVILQTNIDLKIGNAAEDEKGVAAMEEKLRASIWNNREFIGNLTTSLEASRQFFINELTAEIDLLPDTTEPTITAKNPLARSIKIVSLDLEFSEVHAVIEKMKDTFPAVRKYFTQREEHKINDENDKSQNRFITSLHVTFAHASQMPQATMLSSFEHLVGVRLQINATALLFSDKIAAIQVEIPVDSATPKPMNPFPHITIWCSENAEAYESNDLPEMVNNNQAERVVLEQPVVLEGVFRFWYDEV